MKHLIIVGLMSIFGITCSTHPGGEKAGNIFPPDYQGPSTEFLEARMELQDEDPLIREATLLELVDKEDLGGDYKSLISYALDDTSPFVCGTAVWAHDRIGGRKTEMFPLGTRRPKKGGDPEFEFDYRGISASFDEIDDPDVRKRLSAMVYADYEMLAGKLVTDGVLNDIDDEDPRIRYWAVEILGHTGGWEHVAQLMGLLDDPDDAVRANTVEALGDIGTNASETLDEIARMLQDDEFPTVRALAARAMVKIDPAGKTSVDALIASMGDDDKYVRWSSVIALGELGADAVDAIPHLSDTLVNDDEYQIKEKAAETLGLIGPAALPALIGALESDDEKVPRLAARGLAILGPDAAGAVPYLIEVLGYNDIALQKGAINALGAIGPAAAPAASELVFIIEDTIHNDEHFTNETMKGHRGEIPTLVASAVYAIGNIGPDAGGEVVPLLKELLIGRRYDMKVPAAYTLGCLGPLSKDAVGALIFLLLERSAKVRYNVATALGLIGPDASSALPRLREIASTDPNGEVRIAAEEAIAKIE